MDTENETQADATQADAALAREVAAVEVEYLAYQLANLTALEREIGRDIADTRARLLAAMASASLSDTDVVVGGVPVATIRRRRGGRASARIADTEQYAAWVQERHPDRVSTRQVVEVDADFTKGLLREMTEAGSATWLDDEHDEEIPVPGAVMKEGPKGTAAVTLAKGGADAIGAAWREDPEAFPVLSCMGGES